MIQMGSAYHYGSSHGSPPLRMKSPLSAALALCATLVFAHGLGAQPVGLRTEPIALVSADDAHHAQYAPDASAVLFTQGAFEGVYRWTRSGNVSTLTDLPGTGFGYLISATGEHMVVRAATREGLYRREQLLTISLSHASDEAPPQATPLVHPFERLTASPRWSSDGSNLLLQRDDDVYWMPTPGRAPSLGKAPTALATIGSNLVFVHEDDQTVIRVVGKGAFEGDLLNLVISPDGQYVAFEELGGALWLGRISDRSLVDLVELGVGHRPAFDRTGSLLAFMRTTDDGYQITSSGIWVTDLLGQEGPERAVWRAPYPLVDRPDRLEMNPHFSPTDDRLLFDADGTVFEVALEVTR